MKITSEEANSLLNDSEVHDKEALEGILEILSQIDMDGGDMGMDNHDFRAHVAKIIKASDLYYIKFGQAFGRG